MTCGLPRNSHGTAPRSPLEAIRGASEPLLVDEEVEEVLLGDLIGGGRETHKQK